MRDETSQFIRKVLIALGIIVLFLFVRFAADILLLGFAGILLALFLRAISNPIARFLRINEKAALGIALVLLAGASWLLVRLVAPDIADQVTKMRQQFPSALEQLKKYTLAHDWIQSLLQRFPELESLLRSRVGILSSITNLFSTTFTALLNFLIIVVLGLYFAFEPGIYVSGVLRLVPNRRRGRADEVLMSVASILRRWLLGRILSMTVVGLLTWAGLLAFGIPLALSLSLIAALLTFIPNIGPILSVVPAALLALLQGPDYVLYVVLLYTGVQTVESYLITPIIQQHTVSMPPALLILNQIVLGLLLGFFGLLLATPLTAAGLVLIKMLYLEDVLKERIHLPGKG